MAHCNAGTDGECRRHWGSVGGGVRQRRSNASAMAIGNTISARSSVVSTLSYIPSKKKWDRRGRKKITMVSAYQLAFFISGTKGTLGWDCVVFVLEMVGEADSVGTRHGQLFGMTLA
jgi:hypothetical protein